MLPAHFKTRTNSLLKLSAMSLVVAALSGCGEDFKDCNGFWDKTFGREECAAFPMSVKNKAPAAAQLVEVSSFDSTSAQLSWLAATDDSTLVSKLMYQIHASETLGFKPNASTLKQTITGQTATTIKDLKPNTQYYLQVVAMDEQGLSTASNELSVSTSAIPSAIKANVNVKVISDFSAISVTENQLVFNSPSDAAVKGQFVVASKEGGFLRQATNVTLKDGKAIVDTKQASLSEVYDSYTLNSTIKLVAIPSESAVGTEVALATGVATKTAASPETASATWKETGLTLSTESESYKLKAATTKAGSVTPQQALSVQTKQAVIEGATVSASPQKQNFVGDYAQALDMPRAFSISKNTTGTIKIPVILHTSLKEGGWLSDDQHIRLCSMTNPDVGGKNGSSLISSHNITLTKDNFDHYYKGEIEIKLNPTDQHLTLDDPYHIDFTVRSDTESDNCNGDNLSGTWEEQLDISFDVFVTDEPSFPKSAKQTFSFEKDFKVDGDIDYTIEPKFVSEVRKGSGSPLSYARLEIQSAPKVIQELTITATAKGTLNRQTKQLFERKFTKVYLLGSVPVVMSGVYGVDINVEGEATGALKVNEKLEFGYDELNYGVIYENGQYRTVQSKKPMYTLNVRGDADATAQLKISLTPRLSVSFYNALTGRLIVEPYVEGKAGLHGQVTAVSSLEAPELVTDIDGWLTEASVYGGIDAYVAADLTILGQEIKAYPEGFDKDDLSTYQKLVLLAPVEIIGLPKLKAERGNLTDTFAAHSRAIKIYGKVDDVVNPFGGQSILKFSAWTKPKLVAEETPYIVDGEVFADPNEKNAFWFVYNKAGKYRVRLGAYSNMGAWARQVTTLDFDLTDVDNDGMVDEWERKYGTMPPRSNPDLLPNADEDHDFLSNLQEYKQGTNPVIANMGVAGITVSPTNAPVYTEVSFSLTGLMDSIKSVVWQIGETVINVFDNVGDVVKQMFGSAGDVFVSATLKDAQGVEVSVVSTTVTIKPSLVELDQDVLNDPTLENLYEVQKVGLDTSDGTLRLPLNVGEVDSTFPYIWIANSGEGTISKLDVKTGVELGRYRTGPSSGNGNPSRTTVDQEGNVWVGNRDHNTITKVGLKEFGQCIDRNNNGFIDSSTSKDDVKSWGGYFGDGQSVANAEDECILLHITLKADGITTPSDIRTVAIDPDNNVFVGGSHQNSLFKVNGTTGAIIKAIETQQPHYGGLVDKQGNLWSIMANYGRVQKVDKDMVTTQLINVGHNAYGIAIDKYGKIWATEVGTRFSTFDPADPVGTLKVFNQTGNDQAQGIATDDNGDVFIAGSLYRNVVGHYKQVFTNGVFTGVVFVANYPVGRGPTGVAVDGSGKVWASNYYDSTVSRITLAADPVNAIINTFTVGYNPYNYSDMTGRTVRNITNRQGTWEATFDGATPDFEWKKVVWTLKKQLPEGTAVTAYAKVANSKVELGGKQYLEVQSNQVMTDMKGRFIKVKFRLTSTNQESTPEITGIDLQ